MSPVLEVRSTPLTFASYFNQVAPPKLSFFRLAASPTWNGNLLSGGSWASETVCAGSETDCMAPDSMSKYCHSSVGNLSRSTKKSPSVVFGPPVPSPAGPVPRNTHEMSTVHLSPFPGPWTIVNVPCMRALLAASRSRNVPGSGFHRTFLPFSNATRTIPCLAGVARLTA